MGLVRAGSRVEVPTKSGGKTLAGVAADTSVENLGGRRRRALSPLSLFKRDHPQGGEVPWTLPEGTIFYYLSGPSRRI